MSKTALVVDDSRSARFALRKFLESCHYQVETAESAVEAFKYLANTLPDVIFLDHIMPVVDGFEVLRLLKTDNRMQAVPVVICSSNEGEEYVAACLARGASRVLPKPPSAEQIAGVLAKLVNRTANYEAALAPLKPEDYTLAATLAPVLMPGQEPDVLMNLPRGTVPNPAAQAPVSAPSVDATPLVLLPVSAPRSVPDLQATIPMPEGPAAAEVLPTALPLAEPPALATEPATMAAGQIPGDLDQRIGALTQDVFAEMTALRAQITALQGQLVSEDKVRGIAIEAARGRTNALAASLEQHLGALRHNLEAVLRAQSERMQQIAGSIRQIAAEEARRVLTRSAPELTLHAVETPAQIHAPQSTGGATKAW